MDNVKKLAELLELSRELGREERDLAILGEGNTSQRVDKDTFWVKASGSNLKTLGENDVTLCRFDALLPLLETAPSDVQTERALLASRVDKAAKKPSVEAMFHAYLLSLPEVNFVGHTHPIAVNGVLCSPRAEEFAAHRLLPDQIVCCGAASALVPYVDPGVPLACAIRRAVEDFLQRHGEAPREILLRNHGLIALGRTPQAVLATTLMTEKSARIFLGGLAAGEAQFLSDETVARISGRADEHYRRRALGL